MASFSETFEQYEHRLFSGNVRHPLDRLRLYAFVSSTLLVVLGTSLHFLGIMGVSRPVLLALSFCWCCVDGTLLVLFLTRRIGLKRAFVVSAVLSQLIESARILYLAGTHTISQQQFYVNEFICISILLMVIMGFFYKPVLSLTVINMATIIVCHRLVPDMANSTTISFFILLYAALYAYSFASVSFVKQITMENDEVKGKYNSFLSFMRMSDTEATALIQLTRTAFDDKEHVDTLVNHLSEETKGNLVNVAERISSCNAAQEDKIQARFPQLSSTELTVCRLVVEGYTQKDIARIMDKTENNISTVRGNVRRKLLLDTSQDLRSYLVSAVAV